MPVVNIDMSATADLVAAPAPGVGYRYRVVGWRLTSSAALSKVAIRSGAAGTVLTTSYALNVVGGIDPAPDGSVNLIGDENQPIRIEITGVGSVGGHISFRKERI